MSLLVVKEHADWAEYYLRMALARIRLAKKYENDDTYQDTDVPYLLEQFTDDALTEANMWKEELNQLTEHPPVG